MESKNDFPGLIKEAYHLIVFAFSLVILVGALLLYLTIDPSLSAFDDNLPQQEISIEDDPNKIENGIHLRTGLVEAEGLITVVNNCTSCHSAKLIIQNRMTAERWNKTIKWMQETQNLGDLGSNQEIIVNYLVTNYPPKMIGRREILTNIDWYELEVKN